MNGFKILADGYRKNNMERKAELLDFLGDCSYQDICDLFDSSAFNEIAWGYLHRAVTELVDEGVLSHEQALAVRKRYKALFEEVRPLQASILN